MMIIVVLTGIITILCIELIWLSHHSKCLHTNNTNPPNDGNVNRSSSTSSHSLLLEYPQSWSNGTHEYVLRPIAASRTAALRPRLLPSLVVDDDNNDDNHRVFLLDAIWIPHENNKLVLLGLAPRMFTDFADPRTAKVHSKAYNKTFPYETLASPLVLVPNLFWNDVPIRPDQCQQVSAQTTDGNINHKLFVVHCYMPDVPPPSSSSSSADNVHVLTHHSRRRQSRRHDPDKDDVNRAVDDVRNEHRPNFLILAQFDDQRGIFNAARGMEFIRPGFTTGSTTTVWRDDHRGSAMQQHQHQLLDDTVVKTSTTKVSIVIQPVSSYHPLIPDILDYYRKQGIHHVYVGLVHPSKEILNAFTNTLSQQNYEDFVSLGWFDSTDVVFDYGSSKHQGHMLLKLMFANSALHHAKALQEDLLVVADLEDVLVSAHPTKTSLVEALEKQIHLETTCFAVPSTHVVWRNSSSTTAFTTDEAAPRRRRRRRHDGSETTMTRLGEQFPRRCNAMDPYYHKSVAVVKNCDFVGSNDHGACRDGTTRQDIDSNAVTLHHYTSFWGKTRRRCKGPDTSETKSELARFQQYEFTDAAPLVVVVPGLANVNRLASVKRSLQKLTATAEQGLRCVIYISDMALKQPAADELADCEVVYNRGLWTNHVLRVDESVVKNATHVAVLTDSVDASNVDAASFLATMNHAGYDVASAAIPGWHYDVIRPREECKCHRTDFTDISFTVFTAKAWSCWTQQMDLYLNGHGWGYDVTLAEKCDAAIGIVDDAVAVYEGSCDTDDDCTRTHDDRAAMSQLRGWIERMSGARSEADARSYWKHVVFYRPKLFRRCDLHHSVDKPRKIPMWQVRAELDARGHDSVSRFLFAWSVQGDAVAASTVQRTVSNYTRQCSSPEYNVTWPLAGSTPSVTSSLRCGISKGNPLSDFFRELQMELNEEYGDQCQDWVRFGVAFGEKFVEKFPPVHKNPHKCSFMFVLREEMPQRLNDTLSFGQEILVPIPRAVLPYNSLRRNVKLFKMHGHVLFPFAKHLVWQDAKLKGKVFEPTSYYTRFLQTELGSPCLTTIGLPPHKASFGKISRSDGYRPRFQDHCDTVANAIVARPNVTDSVDTLLQQCRAYQEHVFPGISLDRGLIDSAFILWNQESPRCREFNAKLACTWSDEIQCFSDRDQLPFPYVLKRLGVRESRKSTQKKASRNNIYLVDDNNEVTVQVLRSDCHWYYNSFPRWCTED